MKAPSRILSIVLVIIVVLIVFVVAWYWWRADHPNKAASFKLPPVTVGLTAVKVQQVPNEVHAMGSVIAPNLVEIKSQVAGHIVALNFKDGAHVTKGQLLLKIDDAQALADLAKAKSQMAHDKLDYQRIKQLFHSDPGAVSKSDLDDKLNTYKGSLADYQTKLKAYNDTRVYAPFDGVLSSTNLTVGSYLQVGDTIVSIVNPDQLQVEYQLPARWLPKLHVGQAVQLMVDAYPNVPFKAQVVYIAPTVDQNSRTVTLRAQINHGQQSLHAGELASVKQTLDIQSSLTLPAICLTPQMYGYSVYTVQDNKAQMVTVKAGQRMGDRMVITSGLKLGQTIICPGQDKVKDGSSVKVVGKTQ